METWEEMSQGSSGRNERQKVMGLAKPSGSEEDSSSHRLFERELRGSGKETGGPISNKLKPNGYKQKETRQGVTGEVEIWSHSSEKGNQGQRGYIGVQSDRGYKMEREDLEQQGE